MEPSSTATASNTRTSAAATVAVKPSIRPFPLDASDKSLNPLNSASTSRESQTPRTNPYSASQKHHTPLITDTPSRSSNSTRPAPRKNPYFVLRGKYTHPSGQKRASSAIVARSRRRFSSDSDAEEVDARKNASQATGEDYGEPELKAEEDEREEDVEETKTNAGDDDAPQDEQETKKSSPPTVDHAEPVGQGQSSRLSSPASPSSSSSLSSSPLRSIACANTGPKPKAVSLSQPPAETKKRPFPSNPLSATQPAASSTPYPLHRLSVNTESAPNDAILCESEEDDQRYAKRSRTSANSAGPSGGKAQKRRTRNRTYWFLDGSVVLQLEDQMFRLHRSRLANQSTYFQELFSAAPGDGGAENGGDLCDFIDKCPVFKVKGVSVADFEQLLMALDNAISYVYSPPEFSQLASILRAAQTLRFSALEDFASRTLRQMWSKELSKLTESRIKHAPETIILAREYEMPELLKRAFYELVRTARLGEDEDADSDDPDVASTQISRQDLVRLIRAREELVARWILTAGSPPEILCPLAPVEPPSKESAKCMQARANLFAHWNEVVKKGLFEEYLYDPLVGLQRLVEHDWTELGYCRGCVKAWRDSWMAQRVKLWQQLELWLGLPADEDV
ncbi:hypothetical protein BC835DRAFT_1319183 [Cytidiella melzeri]|nr:hypothetical protein BC835DRAFT_1319183 [Cytidiella melzeri]